MKKQNTLSFTFVPQFKEYENKFEVMHLLMRNKEDLNPKDVVFSEENQTSQKVKPSESLVLVHLDDLLIGVSILTLDGLISGAEELESNLLVRTSILDPVFRGKGIGSMLYREIEDLNVELFKRPVILRGTWDNNPTQHHLLTKLGYSVIDLAVNRATPNIRTTLYAKNVVQLELVTETLIC